MAIKNKDQFTDADSFTEEPWSIIQSYFRNNHLRKLVEHQLESYNEFINCQVHKTIDMFNTLRIVSDQDYNEEFKKYFDIKIN